MQSKDGQPDFYDGSFFNATTGEELSVQVDPAESKVFMTVYDEAQKPVKKYIYNLDDPRTLGVLEPFVQ